jgi:CRP-like cAMP-binding protein
MSVDFDILNANISSKVAISDEDFERAKPFFQKKIVSKKTFLQQAGQVSRGVCFVTRGLLRMYSVDSKGEERIIQFAPENWWIADLFSAISGKESQYYLESLEDSEYLFLENYNREKLLFEIPVFERFFRILIENRFVALQERMNTTLSEPAEEKYRQFLEKYPTLPQRVSQKMIASFLGIQPETLSRIRAKKN